MFNVFNVSINVNVAFVPIDERTINKSRCSNGPLKGNVVMVRGSSFNIS